MSMAEPKHAEEIEQAKAAQKARKLKYTVGYVLPNGIVQAVVALPPDKGLIGKQRGDVPVLWINGAAQVTERHAKLGGKLLQDICNEDGCPEKYKRWHDVIAYGGKIEVRNVEEIYPPTVMRMRREASRGTVEGMIYDATTGSLVPATEDAKASRVAELADAAGVGRPSPSDRQPKAGSKS